MGKGMVRSERLSPTRTVRHITVVEALNHGSVTFVASHHKSSVCVEAPFHGVKLAT